MSRIPALKGELVAAAGRRSNSPREQRRGPARTSRRALLIAALILLVLAASAGAVLTGVVGGSPTAPFPRIAGEERSGMVRTRSPLVLGVADIPDVGHVELVGYRMRGYHGQDELTCFDLALPDGSKSGACGVGLPGEAAGIQGLSPASGAPSKKLAMGLGGAEVDSVVVRFGVGDRRGSSAAVVMHVPASVGNRLGAGAFAYYIGVIPAGARDVVAEASDAHGSALWRGRFPFYP
jgi:hypothetical protein